MKGFEAHHWLSNFLDEAVILFNNIVQIVDLEYFNKTDQTSQHQQAIHIFQSGIIGTAFIQDDFYWQSVRVNRLPEKGSGRGFIAFLGEHEINGIAEFIDSPVQVTSLPFDLDIRFIHMPGSGYSALAIFSFQRQSR